MTTDTRVFVGVYEWPRVASWYPTVFLAHTLEGVRRQAVELLTVTLDEEEWSEGYTTRYPAPDLFDDAEVSRWLQGLREAFMADPANVPHYVEYEGAGGRPNPESLIYLGTSTTLLDSTQSYGHSIGAE